MLYTKTIDSICGNGKQMIVTFRTSEKIKVYLLIPYEFFYQLIDVNSIEVKLKTMAGV